MILLHGMTFENPSRIYLRIWKRSSKDDNIKLKESPNSKFDFVSGIDSIIHQKKLRWLGTNRHPSTIYPQTSDQPTLSANTGTWLNSSCHAAKNILSIKGGANIGHMCPMLHQTCVDVSSDQLGKPTDSKTHLILSAENTFWSTSRLGWQRTLLIGP